MREVLERGPATLAELATATALSSRQVHYALQLLREQGSVVIAGGRGTYTVYRLTGNAAQA
ncbi:hypothetical protein N5079_13665 [Planotetraspora sp. A-T 1434]|uniref:FaeA/PapI family transcriptional regulator n=1 Tax=Planotetraspora sp. A-T 1434 TaxID=2979219 RepID=UPI0021BFD650|nr:FaeA/PapI family transcriptional regulator [Planotetraspora sp. A-T 1434]MCT9931265.1 hypothetical protein [Planotetraspora sp. A-T 1434]